jgi:hypothetical protein
MEFLSKKEILDPATLALALEATRLNLEHKMPYDSTALELYFTFMQYQGQITMRAVADLVQKRYERNPNMFNRPISRILPLIEACPMAIAVSSA